MARYQSERGIVSVKEVQRGGRRSGIDEFGNRHYTRHWEVLVDNPQTDALEATAGGQLPALFSFYWAANGAKDFGATLRSYECEQQDNLLIWHVTANYSSAATQTNYSYNPFDFGEFGGGITETGDPKETDPLLRTPQIRWGTIRVQRAAQAKDLDGKGITASNGQRFDPPVMIDRAIIVLSISRNESLASFSPQKIIDYENKVNDGNWIMAAPLLNFTFGDGLARCESITADSQAEQFKHFWRVNYTFHINPNKKKNDLGQMVFEGWQPELMDVGTYELLPLFTKWYRQTITDGRTSMPVTSPVPLNGTGKKLDPTSATDPDTFVYKYRSFRVYDKINFNTLGLP